MENEHYKKAYPFYEPEPGAQRTPMQRVAVRVSRFAARVWGYDGGWRGAVFYGLRRGIIGLVKAALLLWRLLLPLPRGRKALVMQDCAALAQLRENGRTQPGCGFNREGFAVDQRQLYKRQAEGTAPGAHIRFGRGTFAENGCGCLALYNVCRTLGIGKEFSALVPLLERGLLLRGKLGVDPFALRRVLRRLGLQTRICYTQAQAMRALPTMDAGIYVYGWYASNQIGAHYVAVAPCKGGRCHFYNGGTTAIAGKSVALLDEEARLEDHFIKSDIARLFISIKKP